MAKGKRLKAKGLRFKV